MVRSADLLNCKSKTFLIEECNFLKVVSTVLGIRSTCSCARWEERGTSAVSRLADSRAVTLLGKIII